MIEIVDLNACPLSYKNATYGGMAGSKDGILIDNQEWMVKYPKSLSQMDGENASYSTAPLSEYLGSHVYEILGYDVHQTMLGERNGKLVVACKDFAINGKALIEIRTIKNHTGKELEEMLNKLPKSSLKTHFVDLDELMLHLEKNPVLSKVKNIKQRFFEQAIVDVFINNNDRNNGNWGILRERGKEDILAPVFDNGGSFSNKLPENKLIRILESGEFQNNATNILTAYGKDGHQYSAKRFFDMVKDIPEFQEAVRKLYPLMREKMPQIVNMMQEIPATHCLADGEEIEVFSDKRKEFYIKQLNVRLEKLIQPQFEKVLRVKEQSVKGNSPGVHQNVIRTGRGPKL